MLLIFTVYFPPFPVSVCPTHDKYLPIRCKVSLDAYFVKTTLVKTISRTGKVDCVNDIDLATAHLFQGEPTHSKNIKDYKIISVVMEWAYFWGLV